MPEPCPGMACNGRYWRAVRSYDRDVAAYDPLNPATSRPEPPGWDLVRQAGEPIWCPGCTARIRRELASLDDLASLLLHFNDGYETTPRTEKVGGSSDPGSASPVADQLDEMDRLLALWEGGYRALRGWDAPPPRGTDADRRTTAVAWLTSHLDGILSWPEYGRQFGLDVLDWRKSVARAARAGAEKLTKPLRCPGRNCGQLTMTWEVGGDRVECQNPTCGLILTWEQYEAEVEKVAAAIGRGEIARDPAPGAAQHASA